MSAQQPQAKLDSRFSSPGAEATPWPRAEENLQQAGVFWISTVRPDGRPHVTPLAMFGSGWGEAFSQTRYQFPAQAG